MKLWAYPQSFGEWVESAKQNDPLYLKSVASHDVAVAKYRQSISSLLPSSGIRYARTWADVSADTRVPSLFVDWTLIKNFQDWSAMNSTSYFADSAKEVLLDSDILLRERLAKTLLDFSKASETVRILEESLEVIGRRIKELEKRVSRGQNRQVDLINTRIELLEQKRKLNQSLKIINEKLEEVYQSTGVRLDSKVALNIEKIVDELKAQNIQRPDFKYRALEYQLKSAESDKILFWGKWVPSLTLNYSYFPYKGDRNKTTSLDQWKFGIAAEWVFFEGLKSFALRKEKAASAIAAEQDYLMEFKQSQSRTQLWKIQVKELLSEIEILNEAVKLADKAFEIQERDYRLGLVTDLDVANSVQNRLNIRLTKLQVIYDLGLHYVQKMKINDQGENN